jgi:predicted nucleic acid-binding protein
MALWELLERAGTPIGNSDLLIAAHALALGVALVSNNLREFERVQRLKLENWVCVIGIPPEDDPQMTQMRRR